MPRLGLHLSRHPQVHWLASGGPAVHDSTTLPEALRTLPLAASRLALLHLSSAFENRSQFLSPDLDKGSYNIPLKEHYPNCTIIAMPQGFKQVTSISNIRQLCTHCGKWAPIPESVQRKLSLPALVVRFLCQGMGGTRFLWPFYPKP